MLGLILKLFGGKVGLVMAGGAAVLVAVVAILSWRLDHAKADLSASRATATAWRKSAEAWRASRDASEAVRRLETATDRQTVNDALLACDARVGRARASGEAVQSLIAKEPSRDAQGCPIRELVPADLLRRAIDPPR